MSHNVELKTTVQPPTAPQNPDSNDVEATVPTTDYSTLAGGNENGGVYFELNWQTGQGQNRQQNLLTTYSGRTSVETPSFDSNGNILDPTILDFSGNSSSPTAPDFNGNAYSPNAYGYGGNHSGYNDNQNESNLYGYGENLLQPDYYGVNSNEPFSLYSTDNSSVLSWNDLVDLIGGNRDFSDFQNETPEFWHEVRQFSETNVFQSEDGTETTGVSKYENRLTEMQSKELSPEEFAETLPPKEREVFKARNQIDETFGANLFESDGVTLSETGQSRVREVALENGQTIVLPANARFESHEGKPVAFVEKAVPENENEKIVPVLTRREIINNAKNAVVFGENIPNRPLSKRIESGEIKLQDKSTQVAVGNSTTSTVIDNGAARVVNNMVADNSSSVNSIVRRDGGAAMGGALINGSLASFDNFKNTENKGVGNSNSVGNANFNGGKSFAAGATGTMMSAAIGSLIPGSDAVVSGVVGFISGVVIGAEADQGLRWLSGERPTIAPSNNNLNLPEENSFAPTLQLATA